jgi:hypothetical protein
MSKMPPDTDAHPPETNIAEPDVVFLRRTLFVLITWTICIGIIAFTLL